MKPLKLAYLDITRRPLSSAITVFSIALSVATAGLLLRMSNLAERRYSSIANSAEALVGAKAGDIDILLGALNAEVSREDQTGYLPMKLFESLKAQTAVHFEDGTDSKPAFINSISPFVYAGFLNDSAAVGTDDSILARGLHVREGKFPSQVAELAVSSRLAAARGYQLGQIVTVDPLKPAQAPSLPFKISAILDETGTAWDSQVWMTLESARTLLTHAQLKNSIWGPDVLNYFLIDLKPGDESLAQLKALVNDRTVGQAVSVRQARVRLQELTGTSREIGLLVVILVLMMAALSLASVLIARFEGLSLQIAVLRAIGYSRGELSSWLLLEGLLLGAFACTMGAIIDAAVFPFLRAAFASALPFQTPSSILESAPIWAAALAATVLSVAIPIIRAYRQDVHNALRA